FGDFVSGEPAAGEPTVAYAGQHWDSDVGLSYAQQRWYAPQLGRFLSDDPMSGSLALPASQNPYAYANANPIVNRDPDGRMPTVVVGAIIGCVGGALFTDTTK